MALAIFLGITKLTVYIFDSHPQVFLGDSLSYLTTAILGWIPPDRSFVYGFLMRSLTSRARSLNSIVAFQTFAGIVTSLVTAGILVRFMRVSFAIASVIATLLALEPQQLLFERFLLTESIGTALFAIFLFLAFEYLRGRQIWVLAGVQIIGITLVMFRVAYVPSVLMTTVLAPLIACFSINGPWSAMKETERKRTLQRLAIHLGISILLFAGLHTAYQRWNGRLSKLPPAYSYADGFFLLANVSTLAKPVDTDNPELAAVISQPLVFASTPDQRNGRNQEMFSPVGLIGRIKTAMNSEYLANLECKRIAYRVIRRDPIGFLRLAFHTYLRFFSKEYMADVLSTEEGIKALAPDEAKLLSLYYLKAEGLPFTKTLTRQYHFGVWPYYIVLLHTPLILLACIFTSDKDIRRFLWFLLVITTLHTTVVQIVGVEPSPRHLHSLAVPLAIAIAVLIGRISRQRETT